MWVAGIDFDSHGIDLVLLEEESDYALHERWPLIGFDAFERAQHVSSLRQFVWDSTAWRNVIALGIEDPRGPSRNADAPIYRTQGAILACLPETLLVCPWKPGEWRKQLSVAHIGKLPLMEFALTHWAGAPERVTQDAADAFCIAYATRMVLVREEATA